MGMRLVGLMVLMLRLVMEVVVVVVGCAGVVWGGAGEAGAGWNGLRVQWSHGEPAWRAGRLNLLNLHRKGTRVQ